MLGDAAVRENIDYSRGIRRLLSATERTTIEACRYYTKQVEKEQGSSTSSPSHYRTVHSLDHKTMSNLKRYSYDTFIGDPPSDTSLLTRGWAQPTNIEPLPAPRAEAHERLHRSHKPQRRGVLPAMLDKNTSRANNSLVYRLVYLADDPVTRGRAPLHIYGVPGMDARLFRE